MGTNDKKHFRSMSTMLSSLKIVEGCHRCHRHIFFGENDIYRFNQPSKEIFLIKRWKRSIPFNGIQL